MWPPPYHTVWESIYMPPMGVPLQTWGCLQPGRKGNHLPPKTTKLCNLRNGHDSITAPSVKPDPGFSSQHERMLLGWAHPGMPEM